MSCLTRSQIDVLKQKLLEQRQALVELTVTNRNATDVVELDQTRQGRLSRMDALQGQAMSKAVQGRRELQIKQIDAALKRIESGEFGYCQECEKEIALKRLEYNPAISLCIDCAE
ncbi:MAG: TraR/DksA family transcriptional regulator [Thioalkalispiraceae bacterium]|jgi:DnaK suppressor protein